MSGKLYFVVGPSGSGKDSLISYAKSHLSREEGVVFARRYITRPPDGRDEQHVPMSKEEFLRRNERGDFLLCWNAHNLDYAIDRSVLSDLRAGYDVVVNGSRAHLEIARRKIDGLIPIVLSAPEATRQARLDSRQDIDSDQRAARLERGRKYCCDGVEDAVCMGFGGEVDVGRRFCEMLGRHHAAVS